MSNVKLGIRVRPMSERQLKSEKEKTPVVSVVDENTVAITNVKVSASGAGDSRERVRKYTADYTYDSSCAQDAPNYASQETVFNSIGKDVLSSISQGISTCVLTYGQSATGKTHTMIGTDEDPGLIPRVCSSLANEYKDISVSFLEIYNEKVHDLLAVDDLQLDYGSLPRKKGSDRKELRVREHPTKGTYVQNLRRETVTDLQSLLNLVQEGTSRRRTAATKRNLTSSRSHALLELITPIATLYLADLAGSEKASWDGTGCGRQKEGANINKSLVALSNVISALVSGGGRGRFVPYRDSALTWLLKDCFTGGAKTFIIATVSPSVACYGETASTLRWAARARQLPAPGITHLPLQATRTALQAQLTKLLGQLSKHFIKYYPSTGKLYYEANHWHLSPYHKETDFEQLSTESENMKSEQQKTDTNSESTESSVTSGSSEVINKTTKKLKDNNYSIERTTSGLDLKMQAPNRMKKRQYRSHEVLPTEKLSNSNLSLQSKESVVIEENKLLPNGNLKQNNDVNNTNQPPVVIEYDSQQRAEIVASVTDRLYTKLKKKEQSTVAKLESVVDKKIVEPLSELRLCTNARQRLIELSHRALKNRRKIGIPAYTQTRKYVIRMKEQGIDAQADLEPYYIKERYGYIPHQDAETETIPATPRNKEVGVGPRFGSIYYRDNSTATEEIKVEQKNSFAMTDDLITSDRFTQTDIAPPAPPRRKRKNLKAKNINLGSCDYNIVNNPPVVNINISHGYSTDDSRESDDNLVEDSHNCCDSLPPDLITNHDKNYYTELDYPGIDQPLWDDLNYQNSSDNLNESNEDFPQDEEYALPKVRIDNPLLKEHKSMEDLILGRNKDMYPYNIILSPPKQRESLRIVKFKGIEETTKKASESRKHNEKCSRKLKEELSPKVNEEPMHYPDLSESFVWKPNYKDTKMNTSSSKCKLNSAYSKSSSRPAKSRFYRDILGIEKEERLPYNSCSGSDISCSERSVEEFNNKRKFFEKKLDPNCFSPYSIHADVMKSCDRLENTVNKYEKFLTTLKVKDELYTSPKSPSKYLQDLVNLRRQFVNETRGD